MVRMALIHMTEMEMTFVCRVMDLSIIKPFTTPPKCLFDMALSYNRPELRSQNQAVRSQKGVVGSKGTKAPMAPSTRKNAPNAMYMPRLVFPIRLPRSYQFL